MKQGETRVPGHRFRLPKSGSSLMFQGCSRDAPGMLQGCSRDGSRWLGRGDRLCHLDDWASPVLHKRHADPKRLGAAGARGMKHTRALAASHTILQFGLTRPVTEDQDGDCTDQGVSVLTVFILFHHKSSSPLSFVLTTVNTPLSFTQPSLSFSSVL